MEIANARHDSNLFHPTGLINMEEGERGFDWLAKEVGVIVWRFLKTALQR